MQAPSLTIGIEEEYQIIDPQTRELVVIQLHAGVTREQVTAATGWPLRFATDLGTTAPPTPEELFVLRDLHARTDRAHAGV